MGYVVRARLLVASVAAALSVSLAVFEVPVHGQTVVSDAARAAQFARRPPGGGR